MPAVSVEPAIFHAYTYGPGHVGGIERYEENLIAIARLAGIRSLCLTSDRIPRTRGGKWKDVPLIPSPAVTPMSLAALTPREIATVTDELATRLATENAKALYSHFHKSDFRRTHDILTKAAHMVGIPIVVAVHCFLAPHESDPAFFPQGQDATVFVGNALLNHYGPINTAPAFVVPGSVDLQNATLQRREIRREREARLEVLFYGRSGDRDKGPEIFLEAIAKSDGRFNATMPEPLDTQPTDRIASNAYLERLLFENRVKGLVGFRKFRPNDSQRRLSQYDVVVIPSLKGEGGPLALMEAIANGAVVVTTDLGGQADLIRMAYGELARHVLIPPNDPDALLRVLNWLADNPEQLELLSKVGVANAFLYFGQEPFRQRHEAMLGSLSPELRKIYSDALFSEGRFAPAFQRITTPHPLLDPPTTLSGPKMRLGTNNSEPGYNSGF